MTYILALVFLALPLPAQEANIDEFFDRFTRDYVRDNPQQASRMQIFSAEEQDRFDRELTPVTREFREMQRRKIRNGLAELKRFDRARLTPEQRVSAACPTPRRQSPRSGPRGCQNADRPCRG